MNVVLIISDTFRRDHLRTYGNDWIRTKHLDALAAESVVFDRAYTGSFPTVPHRHDLLTGRWTFTYKPWAPLDPDQPTLAAWLKEAGLLTYAVADTPHAFAPGYNYQRDFHGWQVIRGQEADRLHTAPREPALPAAPEKMRGRGNLLKQYLRNVHLRRSEEDYFPAQTMRTAAQWLEENCGEQFFLYVDTFDPHEPWDPPQYYVDLYDPGYQGQKVLHPPYDSADLLTPEELKHLRALYAGEVTLVDRWIGFLLDRIETLGLLDSTAIIFTTDHGFYLGEHGWIAKSLIRENYQQYLPLYPEVAHIPLFVRVPGLAPRRTAALVQPVDLTATILDLAGAPPRQEVEGRSLLPLLRGEAEQVRDLAISSPTIRTPQTTVPHPAARSSITDGDWLLIYGSQADATESQEQTRAVDSILRGVAVLEEDELSPQLYDLRSDPACLRNVLSERRDVAERLHSRYVEFLAERGVPEEHLRFFRSLPD